MRQRVKQTIRLLLTTQQKANEKLTAVGQRQIRDFIVVVDHEDNGAAFRGLG
jgi:hypothetical protein